MIKDSCPDKALYREMGLYGKVGDSGTYPDQGFVGYQFEQKIGPFQFRVRFQSESSCRILKNFLHFYKFIKEPNISTYFVFVSIKIVFILSKSCVIMNSIITPAYAVHFNDRAYNELNEHLERSNYSKVFILVDESTHNHCLPH